MGYAKTLEVGDNFTFGGYTNPSVTLSTVAASQVLGYFNLPNLTGYSIRYIYIDVFIGRIIDTSGAANYLDGTTTAKMNSDTGAICVNLIDQSWYCPANGCVSGAWHVGYTNVNTSYAWGTTHEVWLNTTAKSKGNNLILKDIMVQARVIL